MSHIVPLTHMTIVEMNEILKRDGSPFRLESRNGVTFAVNGFFKFATSLQCLALAKLPPGEMLQLEFDSLTKHQEAHSG